MSGKVMGQVYDLDLPHPKQSVLLAMADHAEHDGSNVFASVGLIAWKTGYSARQVQRIIHDCETEGLLVETEPATPRMPATYRIDVSKGKQKPAYKARQNVTPGVTKRASKTAVRGDIAESPKPIEPSLEPSKDTLLTQSASAPPLEQKSAEASATNTAPAIAANPVQEKPQAENSSTTLAKADPPSELKSPLPSSGKVSPFTLVHSADAAGVVGPPDKPKKPPRVTDTWPQYGALWELVWKNNFHSAQDGDLKGRCGECVKALLRRMPDLTPDEYERYCSERECGPAQGEKSLPDSVALWRAKKENSNGKAIEPGLLSGNGSQTPGVAGDANGADIRTDEKGDRYRLNRRGIREHL